MDGSNAPETLGQAGHAITGSGGGGAGGQFVFASLEELGSVIADLESLRDNIRTDGVKLDQAQQMIEPPGDDIMSRLEAKVTVDSLDKAVKHNQAMSTYADAQIAKLRAARAAYSGTDDESAARLRNVDES